MDKPLTPAQQRILDAVRAKGYSVYNARARQPIETLEKAGLITADWEYNTYRNYWRITVKPTQQAGSEA